MLNQRTVIALSIIAPIVLLLCLVLTFFSWLSAGVGSTNERELLAQVGVILGFALLPSIALVVISAVLLRGSPRHPALVVGLVIGLVSAVVALAVIGPVTWWAASRVISLETKLALPFTEREVAFTPDEAEALAVEFAEQTRQAVVDAGFESIATDDGDVPIRVTCNLGNLTRSETVTLFRSVELSAADGEAAFAAVSEHWESLGLRVIPAEAGIRVEAGFGGAFSVWNESSQTLVIQAKTDCFAPPGSTTD